MEEENKSAGKSPPNARKHREDSKLVKKLKADQNCEGKRKGRVNKHEPYYNRNGVLINPKVFKPVTVCCSRNCFENFSEEHQEQEFNRFYAMATFEARCLFIKGSVYLKQVRGQRRAKKKPPMLFKVFVMKNIQVCHKFFLGVFQINRSRVRTAIKKFETCDLSDQRGLHGNYRKKKEPEPRTRSEKLKAGISITEEKQESKSKSKPKPEPDIIKVESAEKESIIVKPLINTPFEKFK